MAEPDTALGPGARADDEPNESELAARTLDPGEQRMSEQQGQEPTPAPEPVVDPMAEPTPPEDDQAGDEANPEATK